MMNQLNEIWKERTGRNLTEEEAWKMVDFVKMVLEEADKKIPEKKENN